MIRTSTLLALRASAFGLAAVPLLGQAPPEPCVTNVLSFTRTDHAIGAQPKDIAVGDWNNDGVLDLVTTNAGSSSLSMLIGTGGGALGPAAAIALSSAPADLTSGDVDGDGVLDLAVAHPSAQRVWILRGDGAGGFAPLHSIPTPVTPAEIALSRFDTDGILDLAIALPAQKSVELQRGLAGGSFAFASTTVLGINAALLRSGDLDGDARMDLCVSGNNAQWVVHGLLGDGAFGFASPAVTHCSGAPVDLELADRDHDGKLDLVTPTADWGDTLAELRTGAGNGGFLSIAKLFGAGWLTHLDDFDGDGWLDYATSGGGYDSSVAWTMGLPGGSVWTPVGQALHGTTPLPAWGASALSSADLDTDGTPELLATTWSGQLCVLKVQVLPNTPALTHAVPNAVPSVPISGQNKEIKVYGAGFSCIQSVRVDGVEVPKGYGGYSPYGSTYLVMKVPLVPHQGTVPLEIVFGSATLSLPLEILPVDPPVLTFASAPWFSATLGTKLQLGGVAGQVGVVALSTVYAPTPIPGLVTLDIGAGGTSLWWLYGYGLGVQGWAQQSYTFAPGLLVGSQFYLQALVFDPANPGAALKKSGVLTGTVSP
jgi:hypothetical protein